MKTELSVILKRQKAETFLNYLNKIFLRSCWIIDLENSRDFDCCYVL